MILVLNLGLKSMRAIVFNEKGEKINSSSLPVKTILRGDFVEQNPIEWWDKGVEVVKKVISETEIRKSIDYITVTSSSSCLVTLDKFGNSLRNCIMVSDKRATQQAEELNNLNIFKEIKASSNNIFALPSLMIPKIMWIKAHEPELFEKIEYFLSPNDYFIYKMTGNFVTDILNAEKFYYNIDKRCYPKLLFEKIGLSEKKLPIVKDIGFTVGKVEKQYKSKVGFLKASQIKVDLSTYDAICAIFGSGGGKDGDGCDVSGTVSSLRVLSKHKPNYFNKTIFSQYVPNNDFYIIGGSNNLGGGLIEWMKQCFYTAEKFPYEIMEREAQNSMPGANGIVFLPYLMGERAPLWNNTARGVLFGLERFHSRGDITRAVFESTGFSIYHIAEQIKSQGHNLNSIRFSGGLSRIKLIGKIKADIFGKKVYIVDEYETTSVGAFILVAISQKLFSSLSHASEIIKIREIILPDMVKHDIYKKYYGMYNDLYKALIPIYRKRKKIVDQVYFGKSENIENL